MFRALGGLEPGTTTTPEELAGGLGEDPDLVFLTLERLVDNWLVESPAPGRYRATGLPRAYATELRGSHEPFPHAHSHPS